MLFAGFGPELVERNLGRTCRMFDQLVETGAIRPRVLRVENPTCASEERSPAVDEIAEFILDYEAAGGRPPIAASRQVESTPKASHSHAIQNS